LLQEAAAWDDIDRRWANGDYGSAIYTWFIWRGGPFMAPEGGFEQMMGSMMMPGGVPGLGGNSPRMLARRSGSRGAATTNAGEATLEVKGGTYLLRDPATGGVMRSGRTNNLARRQFEHARDPELEHLLFEEVHRTDVYGEQRGLEQLLHDTYNPPLNRIGGIDPRNPSRQQYLDAAREFLRRQQGGK
jgi:hypothetical protein